jgi:hypothetical protein
MVKDRIEILNGEDEPCAIFSSPLLPYTLHNTWRYQTLKVGQWLWDNILNAK